MYSSDIYFLGQRRVMCSVKYKHIEGGSKVWKDVDEFMRIRLMKNTCTEW